MFNSRHHCTPLLVVMSVIIVADMVVVKVSGHCRHGFRSLPSRFPFLMGIVGVAVGVAVGPIVGTAVGMVVGLNLGVKTHGICRHAMQCHHVVMKCCEVM